MRMYVSRSGERFTVTASLRRPITQKYDRSEVQDSWHIHAASRPREANAAAQLFFLEREWTRSQRRKEPAAHHRASQSTHTRSARCSFFGVPCRVSQQQEGRGGKSDSACSARPRLTTLSLAYPESLCPSPTGPRQLWEGLRATSIRCEFRCEGGVVSHPLVGRCLATWRGGWETPRPRTELIRG